MRFQNRTILVTGGTSGIGLAAARAFLAEEANVVMAASGRIRGERAESLLREEYGERVRFFPCDVRKEEEICKLMEFVEVTFGGLDTLCNNAGVSIRGRAEEMCVADWDTVLEVNLRGAFLCAKYALAAAAEKQGNHCQHYFGARFCGDQRMHRLSLLQRRAFTAHTWPCAGIC